MLECPFVLEEQYTSKRQRIERERELEGEREEKGKANEAADCKGINPNPFHVAAVQVWDLECHFK